jgi:hypothetical protein
MARARAGYTSQPEQAIAEVRPATRVIYTTRPQGQGEWAARLFCGHWILRLRRPKVGSIVVCWECAEPRR